jgi:hypothetical protein
MNVTYQFQEIRVLFTDNRFVTILKEMATPAMSQIISDGMTRQKTSHKFRNSLGAAEYQEVDVIFHESPSQYSRSTRFHQLTNPRNKILTVLVIKEDRAAFNSSYHHMVKDPRRI